MPSVPSSFRTQATWVNSKNAGVNGRLPHPLLIFLRWVVVGGAIWCVKLAPRVVKQNTLTTLANVKFIRFGFAMQGIHEGMLVRFAAIHTQKHHRYNNKSMLARGSCKNGMIAQAKRHWTCCRVLLRVSVPWATNKSNNARGIPSYKHMIHHVKHKALYTSKQHSPTDPAYNKHTTNTQWPL